MDKHNFLQVNAFSELAAQYVACLICSICQGLRVLTFKEAGGGGGGVGGGRPIGVTGSAGQGSHNI